jgi:hypothetical protein
MLGSVSLRLIRRATAMALGLQIGGCGALITHVEARGRQDSYQRVLSAEELAEFRRLWDEREEVGRPEGFQPTIRLVVVDHGSTSWDYDMRGYLHLVTIKNCAYQRIRDVDAFNVLVVKSEQRASPAD